MATYVGITDSQTDPDAPLTSDLGKAWTNNLIAVMEGASSAPRMAQRVVSDNDTADFSIAVPDNYTGAYMTITSSGGSADTIIAFSDDNGSSYAADNTLSLGTNSRLFVDFSTGAYYENTTAGTFTMPAGTVDRFIFRVGGAGESASTGVLVEFTGPAI